MRNVALVDTCNAANSLYELLCGGILRSYVKLKSAHRFVTICGGRWLEGVERRAETSSRLWRG